MTMSLYKYYPTRNFTGSLQKIRKKDPAGHERILEVIDRILQNPGEADGVMKGDHRGRFKKYVGRRDYRLIYYYCELCRKPNKNLANVCDDCEKIEETSVIFFEVYHKNERLKASGY